MTNNGHAPLAIEKPFTDHREFLPLTLENDIQAIVISDSKCDKAAAALSVKVGCLFDPDGCHGLAHFLEHMLFLGTEKYPEEDDYNAFLAKNGGMSNAYTDEYCTCFFFGVSPPHLEGALDRFAQFFISPLFTESATDREIQAVDSEHAKNRQSDLWRDRQLLKDDANPKHPLCKFGTGNFETLKVIPEREGFPVRQRLLEFHEAHYSSNVMCLVVVGKETLPELVDLVKQKFGPVKNKHLAKPSGPELGGGEPAFLFEDWPRIVRTIPVRDTRSAAFQFVLPQQLPMRWRTKPCSYLSFCIGHEGRGSLLSCLKAKGIATELSAGPVEDEAGVCVFEVRVSLTEEGEKQVLELGECLFTYIRLLQQLPVSEALFNETRSIEEMNFRFRPVGRSVGTASSLAHMMQDGLPIDKVLSGPAKVWELNEAHIAEVANTLNCGHLRLVLASKSFTEDADCPETERWYGARFGKGPLPADWRDAWERCLTGGGGGGGGGEAAVAAAEAIGLSLPRPNPFMPEDLAQKPLPVECPRYPRLQELPPELCRAIVSCSSTAAAAAPWRVLQVFHRQDDTFALPKAQLSVEIHCPWSAQSLERSVAKAMWVSAVTEELNEYAYDAEVAGLFYSIIPGTRGLTLRVGGYQDKLPVLLRKVSEKLAGTNEVTEQTWNIVRTTMLRSATNSSRTKAPHLQASEWEYRCLVKTAVTAQEWLDCLQTMTRDHLRDMPKRLLRGESGCYAEALLQGNVAGGSGRSNLTEIMEALLPTLRPEALLSEVPALGVARLPGGAGSCVLVRRAGTNPEEQNGGTLVSLQAAEESIETVTMCELASQVLSQRCFDELRTKQQLGYIVHLSASSDGYGTGFCGLRVVVQSEKHPAEVHRRIDSWLAGALEELAGEATTDEQLSEYVEALLALKREKPKNLCEEFERNRRQVSQRQFRFTLRDEVIAFLEGPRPELLKSFRDFIRSKLAAAPRMAVEVLGATAAKLAPDDEEAKPYGGATTVLETLEDVEAFRAGLEWRLSNTSITPIGERQRDLGHPLMAAL